MHCADLHLDSPFECLSATNPFIAATLREATFKAFENVIDLAIAREADFILIAGDVYDGADRSLRAQLRFRDGLARAAEHGIWSFVVHGNHDPISGWEAGLHFPREVVRFGDSVDVIAFERNGELLAEIHGISYRTRDTRENLALLFRRRSSEVPAIGLLHCNVGRQAGHENYAPCDLNDLYQTGMDYWALGHIHKCLVINQSHPCIAYPGTTQGRSAREVGPHGCYLVELESSGRASNAFVEVDGVRWWNESVDIEGLASLDDLLESMRSRMERLRIDAAGRPSLVRFCLTGHGRVHRILRREDALADILEELRKGERDREDFVWVDALSDSTGNAIELETYRDSPDFIGELMRTIARFRSLPNGADALRELIAKDHGTEYSKVRRWLSEETLLSALDKAEAIALDLLLKEETP